MNSFRSSILGAKAPVIVNPVVAEKQGGETDGDDLTSVEIPRDVTRSANHREDDRHRLSQEAASIRFKRKTYEVDLINLSGGGAMIRADIKPRLWDRIDLILGAGGAIECAVRWLRGDRIGLEFAHETQIDCPTEQRDALLLEVIRRSFPEIALLPSAPRASDDVVAQPDAADASRRGDPRHPLIWNGEVLWQHDSHKVRLRNISASGALIDSQVDFPRGAEVMLVLGEAGQFFATVGWSRGTQAGLAFAEPFDLSALVATRPQLAESQWERPTHLNPNAHHAWAAEWARLPLTELRADLEGFMKR